jgi:molybdopterin converting factor subunit 1
MKVEVKLFAVARQVVGAEVVTLELDDTATIREVRAALASQYPALAANLRHMLLAVDTEYASDATPVSARSEIAVIPPVSGG